MSAYLAEKRSEMLGRIKELSVWTVEIEVLRAAVLAIDVILATAADANTEEIVVVLPASVPAVKEKKTAGGTARPARRRTRARKPSTSTRKPRAAASKADSGTESKSHRAPRGRPRGSGTRGAEALAIVMANPGITIPEIAEKMGIRHNYLYRVLPGLAENGSVVKKDKGWYPRNAA